MNTKKIIIAARVMSAIFTPFYLPIVGLVALFVFSYLGLLPWAYKLLATTAHHKKRLKGFLKSG